MGAFKEIQESLVAAWPVGLALVGTLLVLWLTHRLLERRAAVAEGYRFRKQVVLLGLGLLGLLAIVLTLPVDGEVRGQLLSFFGIVISAAVALSATTILGNALASVMLRAIRGFQMGDFIRVGEHFGRVSERGLFHTEIQNEHRELTTFPNLYLVTHPVTTVRSSGTIVSATVSLGYDVPRSRVEQLLLEAARAAGLEEPYVQVLELGDFSVTYRAAGLLTEVGHLLSTRSRLRAAMMDALHGAEIEIVSPTFMNQRPLAEDQRFIAVPPEPSPADRTASDSGGPEETVFDKADDAAQLDKLRQQHEQLGQDVEKLRAELKQTENASAEQHLQSEIDQLEAERDQLAAAIEQQAQARKAEESSLD